MIELEKHVLELIARDASLTELLDTINRVIEQIVPECACTILLLDEEQRRFLLKGSGPSVPADYLDRLNGLEIGPEVGACGSAAFRNETVVVEDIATDYRFASVKDFVLSYGWRSVWSVPIHNFNDVVLGTFAMYHRNPCRPKPEELRLVEAGARLAGNVIERLRSERRLRETAERMDLAEKAAAFGIWEVDVPSRAATVSEGFATLTGLIGPRRLGLHQLEAMVHPADCAVVRTAVESAIATGDFQAEFRIVLPDGSIRWERGQGRVQLLDGRPTRATGALIDITEEKTMLLRLRQARADADASAGCAREAEQLEQDRKNILELVAKDRPLDQILMVIAKAVASHLPGSLCSIQLELQGQPRISVSPLCPERLAKALARIPMARIFERLPESVTKLSRDAAWAASIADARGLPRQNCLAVAILQNSRLTGMIVAVLPEDRVTAPADETLLESWGQFASLAVERRLFYDQLSFRAQRDDLTGLLNRAALYDRMDGYLSGGDPEAGGTAVLYLDLDAFKPINDSYGHSAGDAVLRNVARRILRTIRCDDVAARVGGDEFVVLLPGVADRKEAIRVGELVVRAIAEPIVFEGLEFRVGASFGLSMYPDEGRQTDVLLKAADRDMYRTKQSGGLRQQGLSHKPSSPRTESEPAVA